MIFMGALVADVMAGFVLLGLARAQARLGRWVPADRWYRVRLAAPLPATRLLFDAWHSQRAFVQYERLRTMVGFGRYDEATRYGEQLANAASSPPWLKVLGSAAAAERLGQVGHVGPALSRLDALGADLAETDGLRGVLLSLRFPLLLASGRWAEVESLLPLLERIQAAEGATWPVHRMVHAVARDRDREALGLARPLLEPGVGTDGAIPQGATGLHDSTSQGELLAAGAANEIGWTELRDSLVKSLRSSPRLSPFSAPVVTGLEAVAAAERSDEAALDAAIARAARELAIIDGASGPLMATERLLVSAQSRAGRHEAAQARAAALLDGAVSPLGRWRAGRALGEAAEAAGSVAEAIEGYRAALASGIETRLGPEIEGRVARLQSA